MEGYGPFQGGGPFPYVGILRGYGPFPYVGFPEQLDLSQLSIPVQVTYNM